MMIEAEDAVKVAKNNKAPKPDEVYEEYLKPLDNRSLKYLTKFFGLIHYTDEIPSDWEKSAFVMLSKKPKGSK